MLNAAEFTPLVSFHLHAEMFDVYPSGMGVEPTVTADAITLGQMERAVLEFVLPERGRYMFHPTSIRWHLGVPWAGSLR